MREGRSLVPDLPLDEKAAARAVGIFNKLRLPDVARQPAMAEAAGDWFRDIVAALFGSVDAAGERHVREVFGLVPKKNSKTTGGAGIMMTALIENGDPRQEYLLVGPTQEIADLAFTQAAGMIEADRRENGGEGYLPTRFDVKDHVKTIVDLATGSTLKIKTFDMKVMTGAKPKGVLVDELHVMSSLSYAARVIGQIRGGLMQKPDSFFLIITTQSDQPPAGVFRAELGLARGIRDGRVTGEAASMLPVLYEFPEAMQIDPAKPWADPDAWHMVTPNLGLSVSLDRLRADFAQAREKGEEEVRRWASQHLNVEIGLALHTDRWRGADYWEAAGEPDLTLDTLIARSEVIVAGIDGGGLDDLLGLALIGRCRETRRWLGWCRAWAQDEVFARRQQNAARLEDFVTQGDLMRCATPTDDILGVADVLERVLQAGLFPEQDAVGLDPAGVSALIDELSSRGFADDQLRPIAQGFRLSPATWGLERMLKDGRFVHADQPLMDWCVGNAKAEQRGNAVLITKETAGKAKIDPLVALFNAFMLMTRNPEGAGGGMDAFFSRLAA
ncbi:terminase large subunit [Sphingomonas sp.]|uniref:terminase large subunit n=1 Tax=Sphingomonas sp. TaxID=28214 RepID=UPI002D7E842D|nr:terminase TerL endonuclease subunit [Sphingomonas sp.]HEU0045090.1 terminase TerL endonuclease subunit [Sphingomonas sp.]